MTITALDFSRENSNIPLFTSASNMRLRIWLIIIFLAWLVYGLVCWISLLPKTSAEVNDAMEAVTVADGEGLFWGRGRCHICHRIGERGYALRGPNLGAGKDGEIIGVRAGQRAEQLGLRSGAQYLVQSMIDPGAFIVPNYKSEMPKIYEPPIALSPAEIKAVVLYLQSLGGSPDLGAIQIPALSSYKESNGFTKLTFAGDAESGRARFFDTENGAGCASCHVAINASGMTEGSGVGPDLTAIAAYRTAEQIYWKIIRPDSNVVSGYEELFLRTTDDRFFIGTITLESATEIVLSEKDFNKIVIRKDLIAARVIQRASTMPGNYQELLSDEEIHDLVAYLSGLTGSEK